MSKLYRINQVNLQARCDVVFVHGLGGDPFSTWQHTLKEKDAWLHWLQDDFPHVAVWTLAYDASPSSVNRRSILTHLFTSPRTNNLHNESAPNPGQMYVPIYNSRFSAVACGASGLSLERQRSR